MSKDSDIIGSILTRINNLPNDVILNTLAENITLLKRNQDLSIEQVYEEAYNTFISNIHNTEEVNSMSSGIKMEGRCE